MSHPFSWLRWWTFISWAYWKQCWNVTHQSSVSCCLCGLLYCSHTMYRYGMLLLMDYMTSLIQPVRSCAWYVWVYDIWQDIVTPCGLVGGSRFLEQKVEALCSSRLFALSYPHSITAQRPAWFSLLLEPQVSWFYFALWDISYMLYILPVNCMKRN